MILLDGGREDLRLQSTRNKGKPLGGSEEEEGCQRPGSTLNDARHERYAFMGGSSGPVGQPSLAAKWR